MDDSQIQALEKEDAQTRKTTLQAAVKFFTDHDLPMHSKFKNFINLKTGETNVIKEEGN